MGETLRNTDPLCATVRDSRNKAKKQAGAVSRVSGTATLAAGTVTVSNVVLAPGALIVVTRKTPSGTPGHLSVPSANRTVGVGGTGAFVVNSSEATDASTLDYVITNPWCHLDAAETDRQITSANASDLPTSVTLVNELRAKYTLHIGAADAGDGLAHKAQDATNTIAAAVATDLATGITLANEIKTDYEAHRVSTTFHHNADTANAIAAANASDLASLQTLLNELKTDFNLHMGSAPTDAAASIRLVDA